MTQPSPLPSEPPPIPPEARQSSIGRIVLTVIVITGIIGICSLAIDPWVNQKSGDKNASTDVIRRDPYQVNGQWVFPSATPKEVKKDLTPEEMLIGGILLTVIILLVVGKLIGWDSFWGCAGTIFSILLFLLAIYLLVKFVKWAWVS